MLKVKYIIKLTIKVNNKNIYIGKKKCDEVLKINELLFVLEII